jgi:hypothetical protein
MRIPRLSQWDLVEVHWIDSSGVESGWHKPAKKEMETNGCVSVGMVYAQSHDRIVLVLSRDTTNKNIDGMVTIPAVCVTEIIPLVHEDA